MDYTNSLDHIVDPNTGQRMHQDDQAVTTVWSARDSNALNWELMEVVKAGGIVPVAFNPADPQSYSTVLRALLAMLVQKGKAVAYYDTVPGTQAEPVIYVSPFGVMAWADTAQLYRSVDCGSVILHPAATPRAGTIKANGPMLSKTSYAGLWSWAQENGLVVSSASWAAGTAMYADMGADNFRGPDLRGEFLRAGDDGRGVDAGRVIGTHQDDSLGDHRHVSPVNDTAATASVQSARGATWPYGSVAIGRPDCMTATATYSNTGEDTWLYTGPQVALSTGETRPRNVALTACIKF